LILKNSKKYCKRIMYELIYYSFALYEKVSKKNKKQTNFCFSFF
jgi:hypothetical protein